MKFTEVKTLEHLLKEYGTVGGGGHGSMAKSNAKVKTGTSIADKDASVNSPTTTGNKTPKEPMVEPVPAKNLKVDPNNQQPMMVSMNGNKEPLEVISPVDDGENPEALIVKDKKGKFIAIAKDEEVIEIPEGKLSKLASRKGKKLKIKDLKSKIKKLSRKRLKEANPELFEINYNKKEIAKEALDAPVRCGFEAETFFYNVDQSSSEDIDDMALDDIEYAYGDLPDQAYEDYQDWLYTKGQEEYLDELVGDKISEVREDEEWLNDFIDSQDGPSSEAVEQYKKDFEEADPQEYENREEDGWDYMNWVREYVEEEFEDEYSRWLDDAVREEYDLDDEARESAEQDYNMTDWIYDTYSYMSSFLDDYGYEYGSSEGSVEGVANELNNWIQDNSKFTDFPDYGEYGDTYTTTSWAVETDSSINPDEGAGAELISPVFDSPRSMLTEMKSLFDWSEENFGTNNSTGLHVTMSWQGEPRAGDKDNGPNKLKMALLLGDEYLLAEFGRLRNSYAKSQYQSILNYAERMEQGDDASFLKLQQALQKGISSDKFSSINFKSEKDDNSDNELIEFRIAGGTDYNEMYEKVVKAVVRYATVMKAGYDENAYRKEYVKAVSRLIRKSKEIDPKKLKDLQVHNHPVIDSAKDIAGKKDYFDVLQFLNSAIEYFNEYEEYSKPDADKKWKQSIKDYEKGTGDKVEVNEVEEGEPIQGYIKPDTIAPSKRALVQLGRAQENFARAITILARDIAGGQARSTPKSKNIGDFRKFAKQLNMDSNLIQKLTIQSMDDLNFNGTDKENIARLKKGIENLFKQDIVKTPEYLTPQELDTILKKSWQFVMSDDKKDNTKVEKFITLMQEVSPYLDTNQIRDNLENVLKARQENEFARFMKSGSYSSAGVLKAGKITTPGAVKKLLKFLEPYSGYEHPTSPDHHVNIRSDDNYENVAQMRMIQRMRDRMNHLQDLKTDDKDKYQSIVKQLSSIGNEFLTALKPVDFEEDLGLKGNRNVDGREYLGLSYTHLEHNERLVKWNDMLDSLAKMSEPDQDTWNFPKSYDDIVFSQINLPEYYRGKEQDPGNYKKLEIRALLKERFAAIKKFLTGFDKIFQKEGFLDLKSEIKNKNQLDKRNKDFEKNVRGSEKTTFNIPAHSWVYIDKDFYDTITDDDYSDRDAYLENHIEHFNEKLNTTKVYVIPSSHWADAEDATSGLELIDTFEKNKNYYHSWRKRGYKKILTRFNRIYGFSLENLMDKDKFVQGDGDVYQKLNQLGISITHKGDSRKGVEGVTDLLPDEETENPTSGEPISRSSSMSWENINDDAEQKRFDAFDWNYYPSKMKDIVAKEMADKESSFGSFQVALDNVLKKVLKGKYKLNPDDLGKPLDKLMKAAGVEDMERDSSNGIASKTNWTNLSDYLGIERGVNDQGPNLLKKVYAQYDGDHNWRPKDDPDVCCGPRWAAAVKDAERYIKDNYIVSGGNYFRKGPDGKPGDNVSDIYGGDDSSTISTPPEKEFDSDYDKARENYRGFEALMQSGMQNYLARGHVNDLVGFLNNEDNDPAFKQEVLNTLALAPDSGMGPFNDFQSVLASARMNMSRQNQRANRHDRDYERSLRDSVFNKFDKLPLIEQLKIIEQSEILENLSKRSEGPSSDALPDNSIPYLLNKLLSEPMEAGDLRKQMEAFWALPIPQMLSDFRAVRGKSGDKADLRSILRNYASSQLHPEVKKDVKLKEGIQTATEYVDAHKLGEYIKQYGGSEQVAIKVGTALSFFQKKSMEIFYKVESEKGYSVNGKPLEKSLIRRLVPKSVPDDVVGIWIAKNISPKGTKLKPNWNWRQDPKAFTQHPDMIKLRKFVQDNMQKVFDDGNVPITIIHFDQDDEMAPKFRLNVQTNEGKDEVIQKIEDLPDDDSQTDRIVQYIDGLLDDMGVGGRLKSIMSNLDDIDDAEVKRNQLKIAKMIASLEMTNLERAQLLAKWKKDEIVDTKKLLSGGKYDFSEVFIGYGKEDYITEFIDDLSDVIGQGIGAGEFLLATLSSKITGIGSGKGKGDLLIDGNHIELKTKTAKDARFKDYHVQPDATWSGKVEGFKLDFADIEEVANMPATGLNSAMHIKMLQNPKLTSDPARKKKALRSTAGIIQATNTALDKKRINHLLKLLQAGNDAEFRQVYGKYNIVNYLNIKRSEGDLEGIIFMDKQTKTINYVRTEQEVQDLSLNVNTVYLVSKNNIYPYPQIGVRS